jgi:hypothetical protein
MLSVKKILFTKIIFDFLLNFTLAMRTIHFAPFPCRDHLLGSGGVTPAINTLGELQGQEGQQMGWALPHSPFYLQIKYSPACFAKVNPACLK